MQPTKLITSKIVEVLVLLVYLLLIIALLPLSSAILTSYYLHPIVHAMNKRLKIPYLISIVIILAASTMIVIQFSILLIESIMLFIPIVYNFLSSLSFPPFLNQIVSQISNVLDNFYEQNLPTFINAFVSSLGQIMNLFLFYFALIFSLLESKKNKLWFLNLILKKYRNRWSIYFNQFAPYIKYMFFVEFIIFSITFICLIIFFICFHFPYPIHLAFLVALIDLLPMFGLAIFFVPLCVIYFLNKQYLLLVIGALFYFFLISTRQLVDSKLWAKSFQIEMAHSFFITAASLILFSYYGLILAPILIAVFSKFKKSDYFL